MEIYSNKIIPLSQSTIETCLSTCLIMLLKFYGFRVTDKEEISTLIAGIKFTKIDYATGHLVYVGEKYHVVLEEYIDHPVFYKLLAKLSYPKNVKLIYQKVNQNLLLKLIKKGPIIVYIDQYYLSLIHLPHFVLLLKLTKEKAVFIDPWDGKKKKLPTVILMRSIESLRNKLKISPKLIRIYRTTVIKLYKTN